MAGGGERKKEGKKEEGPSEGQKQINHSRRRHSERPIFIPRCISLSFLHPLPNYLSVHSVNRNPSSPKMHRVLNSSHTTRTQTPLFHMTWDHCPPCLSHFQNATAFFGGGGGNRSMLGGCLYVFMLLRNCNDKASVGPVQPKARSR